MRHLRVVRLSLLAALVAGAVASTSASAALPEWGKCVKLAKGKYANAECTGPKAKNGGYEWDRGTTDIEKTGFTSSGGPAELRTTSGIATDCTSETTHGELSGFKEVSGVEVTFQGCHANLLGLVCTGGEIEEEQTEEGYLKEKPGEIKTRELKGKLGYIEGKGSADPVVGISLTPESKKGLFAEFICGGTLTVRVGEKPKKGGGDSIISPITPVNQMGSTAVQAYTQKQECFEEVCNGTGIQIPESFEGGKPDILETEISDNFGEIEWAQSAQTLTTTNTLEEEVEIKA
jgi:hypothetical protein